MRSDLGDQLRAMYAAQDKARHDEAVKAGRAELRELEILEYQKAGKPLPDRLYYDEPEEGTGERPVAPKSDWRLKLLRKETKQGPGEPLPLAANVCAILNDDPAWAGKIAYDAFLSAAILVGSPPWDEDEAPVDGRLGEWSDDDSLRAVNWLSRHYKIHVNTRIVDQSVPVVAARRVVHPVRDWLRSLKHDGTPRIEKLFVDYFGADDTEYSRGVGSRFMIGAVARVECPGAKVDTTPVLEGEQGTGKSTGIRRLAGDPWFFDTPITMGDKDGYQAMRGKWIGELGELHALGKSDLNRAKNFLTAVADHYRPSYARRAVTIPRQMVFVGTTNSSEYLRDETGARRFWPVRCGRIDLQAIDRDRAQLWAEARARYLSGEAWHVDTADFERLCSEEQEDRFIEDEWQPIIETWLLAPSNPERRAHGVTTGQVLKQAILMVSEKWTHADQLRAATIMRRLGWARCKPRRSAKSAGGSGAMTRPWRPRAASLVVEPDDTGLFIQETTSHD